MTKQALLAAMALLVFSASAAGQKESNPPEAMQRRDSRELPVRKVGDFASAAEAYFSPDGEKLIVTANRGIDEKTSLVLTGRSLFHLKTEGLPDDILKKLETMKNREFVGGSKFRAVLKETLGGGDAYRYGSLILRYADKNHNVYIMNIDGTGIRRITGRGRDACTYFSSDGKHIVFSSTRDSDMRQTGDFSDSSDYPAGSEVYIANVDGTGTQRLTFNKAYEAETSFSPDGKWILYTSNVDGNLELYRMTLDAKTNVRITKTPQLQEGGAFYMPDGKRIIFRAWRKEDEGKRDRVSQLYLIRDDGTGLQQLTATQEFNWSPYPSPDGKHIVFAHRGTGNFEIYLLNIETKESTRLTYNPGFDSYAVFSPDGKMINFTSTRGGAPAIYLMDLTPILSRARR